MQNYFPHPSNLRQNDAVLSLRIERGARGYGLFLLILELLREAKDYKIQNNPARIAFAINETEISDVAAVINDYDLFIFHPDGCLSSPWLSEVMSSYDDRRARAAAAGAAGAAARWGSRARGAAAEQTSDKKNSDPMTKNSNPMGMPLKENDNNTYNINEIEKNQTIRSTKLAQLSFGGSSGAELVNLARTDKNLIDNDLIESLRSKNTFNNNLGLVAECCRDIGVTAKVLDLVVKITDNGLVGGPRMVLLIKLAKIVKSGEFVPKHPNEYLLCKLLGENSPE